MAKHFHPRPIDFAKPQENFAEYYGFTPTQPSPRQKLLGMSPWELKYGMQDGYMKEHRPKEHAFLSGKSHGYCCHKSRNGNLRMSGNPKAHRIGAR